MGEAAVPCVGLVHVMYVSDTARRGTPEADRALAVCDSGCNYRERCLQLAITRREEHGVWGGTLPRERAHVLALHPQSDRGGRTRAATTRASCGTDRGYKRHRRAGEDPCADCKGAHAAAEEVRRARRAG